MASILIVDDEDFFRDRMIKAFQRRGFSVFGASDVDEAAALLQKERPELAVVDLKMPGKSGLELIRIAGEMDLEVKVLVLTGYGSIATAIEAVKLGAFGYLSKPADIDEVLAALTKEDGEDSADQRTSTEELTAPSLARVEWEHINRVLADCGGNITQAAKRLGLHRRSLQRKLLKYPPKK